MIDSLLKTEWTGKSPEHDAGLPDPEKGEQHFLPIIGESHVAAMPYEIILQGQEATMLHGRFHFALYWPGLTMKTFTKIMSTPGDCSGSLVRWFSLTGQ